MYLCIFDFDIGCFNISEMYMFLYEVLIWVLELKWKFSNYYIFLNIIVILMLLIYWNSLEYLNYVMVMKK